jgi:hypothetical protein
MTERTAAALARVPDQRSASMTPGDRLYALGHALEVPASLAPWPGRAYVHGTNFNWAGD